jgi:uncharacterized BrkB/YihY/UPF0761 family membrane protein
MWVGTLLASALLVLYELTCLLYVRLLLQPSNYGSLVGFAVVALTFFCYLAFIILLGAEVNALASGLGSTTKSLSVLVQDQGETIKLPEIETASPRS